jgi:DNA-binding GntR family transcriptional regulator
MDARLNYIFAGTSWVSFTTPLRPSGGRGDCRLPLSVENLPDLGAARTASDIIAEHIRDAIVRGIIEEGEPVRQDDVARMFNVSKIPVREALKRLEAEGLVAFQKNRGAVVTSLTGPEIAEMFEVRAILESNAIRLSVPRMTKDTFDRAQTYCDAFANEDDAANWALLNWQFHSSLYEDARRPFLLGLIRSVNDRIERYLRVQLAISGGHQLAVIEHRDILRACRTGDAEEAARLIEAHILNVHASLISHLPK